MSNEITGTEGDLPTGSVVIVASRYNPAICDSLVAAAQQTLNDAGFAQHAIPVIRVPGAWELPTIVQQAIQRPNVVAAIALGCVIKGETTHDEHINRSVSMALMEMGVQSGIPIAFGLLTCNTLEQAINRSGGTVGNKGHEAADAVLELLRLQIKINEIV